MKVSDIYDFGADIFDLVGGIFDLVSEFIVVVLSIFALGIFATAITYYGLNKNNKYTIVSDGMIFYTNEYTEKGGCIEFTSANMGNKIVCGQYTISY